MNILSINNSANCAPNFNGRILTTGSGWNKNMKKTFLNHPEIKELSKGPQDIIGHLSSKKAEKGDLNHGVNERIYRFDLKLGTSKYALVNIINSYLDRLPKMSLIHNYHCEDGLIYRLNSRLNAKTVQKIFGIK